MCEDIETPIAEYPIRIIEVRYGIDEDGGGLAIHVRLDGVEPEKVMEIALRILERVNGKEGGRVYESHAKGYC